MSNFYQNSKIRERSAPLFFSQPRNQNYSIKKGLCHYWAIPDLPVGQIFEKKTVYVEKESLKGEDFIIEPFPTYQYYKCVKSDVYICEKWCVYMWKEND